MTVAEWQARVQSELERHGLLLVQDKSAPSVATLIAGEPIRGSWWGHAAGKTIFHVLSALEDRDEVVFCRLLSQKTTLVHARLVPALAAVGSERAAWQTTGLSAAATALLERVDADGSVRATGKPAKELETRLLAIGRSVHTESGAHATELTSYRALARSFGIARLPSVQAARAEIEAARAALSTPALALPWDAFKYPSRRRRR